jgi:hypothetical protein
LDEPIPETKKVTDFLAGITDSRLSNAKDLILGDPQKLQNFESCQQYLKTLVYNKTTQEKHERQVSGLGRQGNGSGKNRRLVEGTPKPGGVTARTYTHEEWSKLTTEEREKIKELQKQRRARNRDTASRNASAFNTEVDDEDDSLYSDKSTNDSSQDQDKNNKNNISTVNKDDVSIPPTRRSGRFSQG